MDEGEYDGLSLGKAVPPIAKSYENYPGETVQRPLPRRQPPHITGNLCGSEKRFEWPITARYVPLWAGGAQITSPGSVLRLPARYPGTFRALPRVLVR